MVGPLTAVLTEVPADVVRRALAAAWMGEVRETGGAAGDGGVAVRLGDVRLRPHQRAAVARLRHSIAEFGGALLADDVGLGKTYVALAVVARVAEAEPGVRACVVAPATLREMWRVAMQAARVSADFVSVETLSRGRTPTGPFGVVVFDEAHHLRNPATRRYEAATTMSRDARVLLLSATPVHNRRRDLAALLALFLGSRAHSLSDDELARCVVRRVRAGVGGLDLVPTVCPVEWLSVAGDGPRPSAALLDAILALPPPVPPSDGGDGGALVAHALVRLWASSDGALRAALKRRLARASALDDALARGRRPSRAELRAWSYADDAVQLAFPELAASACDASERLLPAVRAHAAGVRILLRQATPERDQARAACLRALRARHAGEKIVAFAAFADTVMALFRELRGDGEVAALTAEGAVVAGGTMSRTAAIARFAPVASGARQPAAAERVTLLLTTDLLSEGVNLQDASVVVHLDLPWTPARLAQRVGRVARIGSAHRRVAVYALSPPATAEQLLAVERRLREKACVAARAVGAAGAILPPLVGTAGLTATADKSSQPVASAPELAELVRQLLSEWVADEASPIDAGSGGSLNATVPLVGAVRSHHAGFLALCEEGAARVLVAWEDPGDSGATGSAAATTDLRVVARVAAAAGGPAVAVDVAAQERALVLLDRWRTTRQAADVVGLRDAASGQARRRVIERIAHIVRRAPLHRRPAVVTLAQVARRAALLPCGAGAERVLGELAAAEMPDDAWLRAVGAFGEVRPRSSPGGGGEDTGERPGVVLRALLLLQP